MTDDVEIDVHVPVEMNDTEISEHLITFGKSLMDPNDEREGQKIWNRNPIEVLARVEDEITGLIDFRGSYDRIMKTIEGR